MNKAIFLLIFFFVLIGNTDAQKFGYVDTDFILNKMPEYTKAQQQIDELSTEWREDIQEQYKEIASMYDQLQAEEVLLTAEMKDERTAEIREKEEEVKEYQKKVFGYNGLFFLKKQELIKPVQDKVFEAVEKIANDHRLQVVFDKAGDLVMIYTNPMHDYTDFVLEELGLGDDNDVIK